MRSVVAVRVALVWAAAALTFGCDDDAGPTPSRPESVATAESARASEERAPNAQPDGTLRTHEIVASTPTAAGLEYIRAVAAIHREAGGQSGDARVATLQRGLALEVPEGLAEAEILRLELASAVATTWIDSGVEDGPARARDLLAPMLGAGLKPGRSLPLDRSSAEALIVLGDAAARTGDDALAAGTYARSLRMMSVLREELER